MDSETTAAPVSGTPLFTMTASVAILPPNSGVGKPAWMRSVSLNLEIRVAGFSPLKTEN